MTTDESPRRTWLVPSLPDLVFVFLSAVLAWSAGTTLLNRDGDLPRHLATGKSMLEGKALATSDRFSHTMYDEPFFAYEWLSQVVLAAVHGAGGIAGVAVLASAVIAASYALLLAFLLRRRVDTVLALAAVCAAALVGATHWAARPHAFSFLGCALLLPLLEPGPVRRLLLVVPFFALWANLHPGFLFGIGILGVVAAGDLLETWVASPSRVGPRLRYYASALALAVTGGLLTPHGVRLYAYVVEHMGNAFLIDNTAEFASPDFHALPGKVLLGIIVSIVVVIGSRGRRLQAPALAVLTVTLALSLYSRRYVALFGLIAIPLLALAVDADWRRVRPRPIASIGHALEAGDRVARRGAPSILAALLLAGLIVTHGRVGDRQVVPDGFDPGRFPVAAVKQAREAGLQGNLFNHFTWGGYIVYAWPGQRVFIDGLTDFYGADLMREYQDVTALRPGWRDILQRRNVDMVVVRPRTALVEQLTRESGWSVTYRDSTAVILTRAPARAGRPEVTGPGPERDPVSFSPQFSR